MMRLAAPSRQAVLLALDMDRGLRRVAAMNALQGGPEARATGEAAPNNRDVVLAQLLLRISRLRILLKSCLSVYRFQLDLRRRYRIDPGAQELQSPPQKRRAPR
jgi:hypothetical protein